MASLAKLVVQWYTQTLLKCILFPFIKLSILFLTRFVCNKLKSYNINPHVINWIISFLSGRRERERVVVDGVITKFVEIYIVFNGGLS